VGSGGEEGRCSWGWTSECSLGVLAPRSAAHAGGEGRAGIKGAEDAPARRNCGGAEARAKSATYLNPSGEQAVPGLGCAGGLRRLRVAPRGGCG
jgi:hypothetical protein